jgi:hypothetical protein
VSDGQLESIQLTHMHPRVILGTDPSFRNASLGRKLPNEF